MHHPREAGRFRPGAALLVLSSVTAGCLHGPEANPRRAPVLARASAPHESPPPGPSSGVGALAPRLLTVPWPHAGRIDAEQTLVRTEQLLREIDAHPLSEREREQRDAGATFLAQARAAVRAGEWDRTAGLASKAWLLIDDLHREVLGA